MVPPTFLHRVRLENYKSIGACDVALQPLAYLVGPNGSGKSNFVDALRFVADALATSLDHAVRERGGIDEVRRRSGGHPHHFGIRLDFADPHVRGHYALEIGARTQGGWTVKQEECAVVPAGGKLAAFDVREGVVRTWPTGLGNPPPASADRLFLVHAAGVPPFRQVYDALSRMGFYNLDPAAMRRPQPPDPGHLLKRDGSNLASCFQHLEARAPAQKQSLLEYLALVVPGVTDVRHKSLGPVETVEFHQDGTGAARAFRFLAANMSDGTVRALGILLALNQVGNGASIPLVAIEEPEAALHPAAVGVLTDSLRDAATRMQVLVTSHSPDLLDDKDVPDAAVLAVILEGGETRIGPLDSSGRETLQRHLYTAGELLRMDQLRPDPALSRPKQLGLFGPPGTA